MHERARYSSLRPAPASKRWLVLLLASILLHWLTIEWADGNLVLPPHAEPTESLIAAQLRPAPRTASVEPIVPAKRANPKPSKKRPSAPATAVSQAPSSETIPAQTSEEPADETAHAPVPDSATDRAASAAGSEHVGETEASAMQANLPPSAELKYDVQAQKKGFSYYGTGLIQWQTDGSRYAVTGKAKAAFFTVLEFKSEGEVDRTGITPVLYTERAGNRAQTNTHFHRERNTISFSASTLSYPRIGGEQDRASIIWQLAALGRAQAHLFRAGEELNIFVAGVRNAAPWRIYILGEEDIQLDSGTVKAWHVKSVPQQGGYEKTFDIWYASGYEWYPVKLRQTEVSGDYLELTLSNLMLAQH